eukprot:8351865-Pyramimonas_sp.AAC.1
MSYTQEFQNMVNSRPVVFPEPLPLRDLYDEDASEAWVSDDSVDKLSYEERLAVHDGINAS